MGLLGVVCGAFNLIIFHISGENNNIGPSVIDMAKVKLEMKLDIFI